MRWVRAATNVFEIRAPVRRHSLHVPKPAMDVLAGSRVVRLGNGSMRRYFLFMRDDGVDFTTLGPPEREALLERFAEWTDSLRGAGRLRGVGRLEPGVRLARGSIAAEPPATSAVRPANARIHRTAPIAVGLHVIEASDEEEAAALARACPILDLGGTVEIREVRASMR